MSIVWSTEYKYRVPIQKVIYPPALKFISELNYSIHGHDKFVQ